MGQAVLPTLSADFRLGTDGLTADAAKAMGVIDDATKRAVDYYARVDAAAKAAADPSAAIAGASAMGAAYAQAGEVVTAAQRRIEAAGERLIVQYDRQAAAVGATREELRAMKAEEAALAAERAGNADLATRIRASEQNLWDAQFQLARRQQQQEEALAQEREAAADRAQADAAAEARAMRDAAAAHQAFEAAARAGMAALREEEAEQQRMIAAAERLRATLDPIGAAQARLNAEIAMADELFAAGLLTLDQWTAAEARAKAQLDATTTSIERQAAAARDNAATPVRPVNVGTSGTGDFIGAGSAKASAAAIEELMAAEDQLAARVKALTAALDPQAAALARANALVDEARALDDGTAEAAIRLAKAERLATDAAQGHGSALGFNRTQAMIAEGAIHRYVDSLAAGMSPMRAFMLQAGDLGNILAMDDGGVSGGLAKVTRFINPFTIGIAAGTVALLAGVVAALSYENAVNRMTALAQGSGAVIGATGVELEAISERAAAAGNVSVASAREIVGGYVQAGGIGKNVLGGLVELTENFARATGVDAKEAQKELGAAFQNPVKGAEDLTARYGSLTQAQIEHIRQLVEANDKYGAQAALLAALEPQFDGAAKHANGLALMWHTIAVNASDAWTAMGKAIDRALGGGSDMDKLADLQERRASLLASNANGMVGQIDADIAAVRAHMAQEKAQADRDTAVLASKSAVQLGMNVAAASTGAAEVEGLKTKLGLVNTALAELHKRGQDGSAAFAQLTTAQQQYTHAVDTYLPSADKAAKAANLDAQIEATKDPVLKRALATQKSLIEQSGQLVTGSQAQAKAAGDGAKAYQQAQNTVNSAAASAAKAAATHAAELAHGAAAEEAQIKNLGLLATAYGQSSGEALIAEAREKAESKAIKDRGDIEAETARQARLAVAQRLVDAAKATAVMGQQASAQEDVNSEVKAGLIPQAQAAQVLQQRLALLPLLAAQDAARRIKDQAGYDAAKRGIAAETAEQERLNRAKTEAQFQSDTAAGNDQLALLKAELSLIGATDAARVHELATIQAEQQAKARLYDPAQTAAYVQQQVAIADQAEMNRRAQEDYNSSLDHTAAMWSIIAENVSTAASDIADSMGGIGKAIGGVAASYTDLQSKQADMARDETERLKNQIKGTDRYNQTVAEFAAKGAIMQVKAYGDMAEAAQGFFKKGSTGYKVLGAAEKAFRAVELALAVESAARQIGLIGAHVAAKVTGDAAMAVSDTARASIEQANSAKSTLVKAVEAVVNAIRSLPFPANLAAGAATAAAIVALGVAVTGGFGGGGSSAPVTNTGTGTVLGDKSAQSASIKNAIDGLKDVDTTMLSTSREMLASLRSIDGEIGTLTTTLINAGNIGSIVGVSNSSGGLFGTSKKIVGSGISGGAESLGSIIATGAYGTDYYADVEKKKKLFGVTTGTSTKTSYASDGSDIDRQFGLILKGFTDTIAAAAGPLGASTDAVTARLNSFVVSIGKVDLTGLSGDEIQKKLEAVFSAEGDRIAAAAIPGLQQYQQAGEGYLQTLTRVASTVETVTSTLDKLGTATAGLGIDASTGIAKQFDSLSDFSSAADAYFTTYYSDAEQAAAKTAQLGKVFDSLGLAMPATTADFRNLVQAQDLTSASGQQTYATLLQIAPAFADLQHSMDGAKSAADILSEQQDLQKQLWEAEGNTTAIRQAELATLDPSNRALQQRLYDLQDEQAATEAASKVAQERAGLEGTLLQLEGDTATIRQRQIDALDPANRALQQQVYALQDQQAAATAAAQAEQVAAQAEQAAAAAAAAIVQERTGLETQLLQLQGDTVALRQRELAALNPANRALQQQIFDLTDLQAATAAAAQAEQAAAQQSDAVSQQRIGIENTLLQLQGNTVEIRARELAGLDESNRALQQQVYALQDQQAATAAATEAAQAAAAAQAQAQQEAEQAAAATAQQRAGLQTQLWQAEGNVVASRQAELDALGDSNKGLQMAIWRWQDAATASQAAAQAAQELAAAEQAIAQQRDGLQQQLWQAEGNTVALRQSELDALDDSNKGLQLAIWRWQDGAAAAQAAAAAAEAQASAEQALAQERQGLMQQLWQLTGDTASIRAAQLASLDPSNRALQQQIWAVSDAQDAAKAAADLANAWKSVGDSIMDEVKRIRGLTDTGTDGGYASLLGQFNAATAAARRGDQDAAKSLPDLSKSLLDAAALDATSRQELMRVQAQTAASLEQTYGIVTAGLFAANDDPAEANWAATTAANGTTGGSTDQVQQLRQTVADLMAEVRGMRTDMNIGNATVAGNTGRAAKVLEAVSGASGGDAIATIAAA